MWWIIPGIIIGALLASSNEPKPQPVKRLPQGRGGTLPPVDWPRAAKPLRYSTLMQRGLSQDITDPAIHAVGKQMKTEGALAKQSKREAAFSRLARSNREKLFALAAGLEAFPHYENEEFIEGYARKYKSRLIKTRKQILAEHHAFHADVEFISYLRDYDPGLYTRACWEILALSTAERLDIYESPDTKVQPATIIPVEPQHHERCEGRHCSDPLWLRHDAPLCLTYRWYDIELFSGEEFTFVCERCCKQMVAELKRQHDGCAPKVWQHTISADGKIHKFQMCMP